MAVIMTVSTILSSSMHRWQNDDNEHDCELLKSYDKSLEKLKENDAHTV